MGDAAPWAIDSPQVRDHYSPRKVELGPMCRVPQVLGWGAPGSAGMKARSQGWYDLLQHSLLGSPISEPRRGLTGAWLVLAQRQLSWHDYWLCFVVRFPAAVKQSARSPRCWARRLLRCFERTRARAYLLWLVSAQVLRIPCMRVEALERGVLDKAIWTRTIVFARQKSPAVSAGQPQAVVLPEGLAALVGLLPKYNFCRPCLRL